MADASLTVLDAVRGASDSCPERDHRSNPTLSEIIEEAMVAYPFDPAAQGTAGHPPIALELYGCKIGRRNLTRIARYVTRQFDPTEVKFATVRNVPYPRPFEAVTLQELLNDEDVRDGTPVGEPVELDNLMIKGQSVSGRALIVEITSTIVTVRVRGGDDDWERGRTDELRKVLTETRPRFCPTSAPSRTIGTIAGALGGLGATVITGVGVNDRTFWGLFLLACIVVTCPLVGWLVADRLCHRMQVRLYSSESAPSGWWNQWSVATKITLVSTVISLLALVASAVNIYVSHGDAVRSRGLPVTHHLMERGR
ncbi:hypothetical protein [Streptomyces sp. NPDC005336]|uniref:hypothetical protein n=1 Tax=Streptomyces sp. NPDC005336 TaxID=3157035 RepID=UPI0033B886BA